MSRGPFHERFSVLAGDQYNAGNVRGFPYYTGRMRRDRFAWHEARYQGREAAYWAGPWPCGVPEACPKCQGPAQWQQRANRCVSHWMIYRCAALHRWVVSDFGWRPAYVPDEEIVIKGTLSV